jgi:hypothetical protein
MIVGGKDLLLFPPSLIMFRAAVKNCLNQLLSTTRRVCLWLLNDAFGGGGGGGSSGGDCLHSVSGMSVDRTSRESVPRLGSDDQKPVLSDAQAVPNTVTEPVLPRPWSDKQEEDI